jgi:hypothetical protein
MTPLIHDVLIDHLLLLLSFLLLLLIYVFWKFLAFQFLFGLSETLLYSAPVPQTRFIPLPDGYQLVIIFFEDVQVFITKTVFLSHVS